MTGGNLYDYTASLASPMEQQFNTLFDQYLTVIYFWECQKGTLGTMVYLECNRHCAVKICSLDQVLLHLVQLLQINSISSHETFFKYFLTFTIRYTIMVAFSLLFKAFRYLLLSVMLQYISTCDFTNRAMSEFQQLKSNVEIQIMKSN